MKRLALIAVLCLLTSLPVSAADWPEGVWATSGGYSIFTFGADNEFKHSASRVSDSTGAWQYQPELCWSGEKKESNIGTTAEGNLMVYTTTLQCCFNAMPVGKKLILTKVWGKHKFTSWLCSNQVLSRYEAPCKNKFACDSD